jgi:membrane-bound hydrogenase subunit beta
MAEEQAILEELTAKFPSLKDKARVQRPRRLFVEAPGEAIREVFGYVVRDLHFPILAAVTGLDQGSTLGVIYHLGRDSGVVLNLSTSVPKERPTLETVTDYFPAAEVYERELVDLLGFQVQGLPEGPRYPLPDEWPASEFPLRKDWKPETLSEPEQSKEK